MQRRQYEVARKTRLYGNFRRFEVANFADHDDIGILAQNRAQATCKRHVDFGIDLRLTDTIDEILNRILDGHNVAGIVIDAFESRVQCCRLARTRRPRNQDNSMWFVDERVHLVARLIVHTKRGEVEPPGLLVKQP